MESPKHSNTIMGGPLDGEKTHILMARAMVAVLGPIPQDMAKEALAEDCGNPDCVIHGTGGVLNICGYPTKASGTKV